MAVARVFLDTSALFAGIWSSQGGARRILDLAEANIVDLLVSSQVLDEIESVIRRKAPSALGALALVLDRARTATVAEPGPDLVSQAGAWVPYAGDAAVLAAALAAGVDYFVTLDRKHFLGKSALADRVPFPIGTPGDFLIWIKSKLAGA
jgi:predicted nucleic acid-binding protein